MEERKSVLKDTLEKLEKGVEAVFESDAYRAWLETLSKFHHYSVNNQILIAMQMPTATQVASYETWKKLGRYVKKGERGIKIIVPTPVKIKKEKDTDEGETEESKIMRYKIGHVFDRSQTDGKDLPTIGVAELVGECADYDRLRLILVALAPVPVHFDAIDGSAKGYYSPSTNEIVVRTGMSETQTIKTLIHEISHALLHSKESLRDREEVTRSAMETEAESVAYAVCSALGLDTGDYSFAYIASWASGKDIKELKASMQIIHDTAGELIDKITEKLVSTEESCA